MIIIIISIIIVIFIVIVSIIVCITVIIVLIIIIMIRFSQVDLVGVVAANSTVGAEELISWACDQYLGKPISL